MLRALYGILRQGHAGLGSFEAMPPLSPQKTEAIAEPEVARSGAQIIMFSMKCLIPIMPTPLPISNAIDVEINQACP